MSHVVSVEPAGRILRITVFDRMDLKAYERIVPYIDSAIAEFETVRLFFDLSEYAGRELGAAFEEAEFDLPNWARVERVAIVGDKRLEPRVAWFCAPFESATVRFFPTDRREAAEDWIHEGVEPRR